MKIMKISTKKQKSVQTPIKFAVPINYMNFQVKGKNIMSIIIQNNVEKRNEHNEA